MLRNGLLFWFFLGFCSACASSAGGGAGSAAAIGGPCNSGYQKELCSGTARMSCNANVWVFIENCGAGFKCTVLPSTDGKGTPSACVSATAGADASGDATTVMPDGSAGSDVAAGTDAVTVDVGPDSAPDIVDAGGCKNGTPCDDGDGCTVGDKCVNGTCSGTPKTCDDGDPCTADSCQAGACAHTAVPCADGSSIDKALPITLGATMKDGLAVTGKSRWFTFNGAANDFVLFATQTAQVPGQYDPTIIDTILTIYGPDQQPLAFNDDGLNLNTTDSEVWTKLPQSGTYYVEVLECWTWLAANPGAQVTCGGTADKTNTDFSLFVVDQTKSGLPGAIVESEPNGTIGTATQLVFQAQSPGVYFMDELLGLLAIGLDADYFALAVPDDVKVSQGRLTASFSLLPGGATGDGSSLQGAVKATFYDADTNGVLGILDLNGNDLRVPVQGAASGKTYAIRLEHGDAQFTSADWYVVEVLLGGSNPLEANESNNNTQSGAQTLVAATSSADAVDSFIGGDIIGSGTDVDWFAINVPSGMTKATVNCGSKFMGSGVVNFRADVVTGTGASLTAGGLVEQTAAISVKNLSIPSGTAKLYLKLTAGGQDATNTGTYYECGVHLTAVAVP